MSPTLLLVALDIDPNVVRPGLTPLIVTILLGVALVFLGLSLRRQVRRISVPYADGRPAQSPDAEESPEDPAQDVSAKPGSAAGS